MKKTLIIILSLIFLFPCIVLVKGDSETQTQSTTLHYSVSATVIYEEYDGTRTIQKVDVGTTLKEPAHKGQEGYSFLGWKDMETGEFWDFSATVERNLTLVACYENSSKAIEKAEVTLGEALLYNGTLQTQEVTKVTLDGETIPPEAYTIENNAQTEPGVYTLTIRAIEGSGYSGTCTWTWVIAPAEEDQLQEDENGEIEIGKGSLSIEVKTESNLSDATIETDKSDFIENLIESDSITADELSDLADGASIDIVVVIADGTASITPESKNLMETKAADYTLANYMDISLYKYVSIDGETEVSQQIHETTGLITISIQVPDSMLNTDENIERTYAVVRNHEGTVELLSSTYDATTHTLTFQTNQFSDYAIAYQDKQKSTGDDQQDNNQSGNNGQQDNNQSGDNQPNNGQQDNNQSGENQPNNGQQDNNQSGENQPNNGQQDNDQSGNNQSNNGQQDNNQSGNNQPNNGQQDNNQSGDSQSGDDQQDNNQSGDNQPNNGQQDNNQSGGNQPGNDQQDNNQSGNDQLNGDQQNNGQPANPSQNKNQADLHEQATAQDQSSVPQTDDLTNLPATLFALLASLAVIAITLKKKFTN